MTTPGTQQTIPTLTSLSQQQRTIENQPNDPNGATFKVPIQAGPKKLMIIRHAEVNTEQRKHISLF